MPWKECHVVEERLRFIARLLDGEKMAGLCREFRISRKTGYKIYDRYQDCGLDGLTDRSRRPYRHANQLPMQVEKLIVALKKEYPRWGADVDLADRKTEAAGLASGPATDRPRREKFRCFWEQFFRQFLGLSGFPKDNWLMQ